MLFSNDVIHRCEAYANLGCIVYATARRPEAMAKLDQPTIHKLTLDVTKDDQVKEVVKTIIEREGKIDIAVNNAGMAVPGEGFLSFRMLTSYRRTARANRHVPN